MIWQFIYKSMTNNNSSFIYDLQNKYTYEEVLDKITNNGDILKDKLNIKTKCAILCKSNYNTAVAILSCWYADLIPIPMSINYGDTHCKNIIKESKPDLIITDDYSIVSNYNIFSFNIKTHEFYGFLNYINITKDLSDTAIIMNTSGTTGLPKGVMITGEGLVKNILAISDYFDINSIDNILIARPLYHCAVLTGEFLISLYKGLNICFSDEGYNPLSIISLIDKMNITVLCGTPTLFHHLVILYKRKKISSTLRVIALSGECLTNEIAIKIREVFSKTEIYNVYGLTEASPRVSYLEPRLFDIIPESVGIALRDTEIKICDDDYNDDDYNDVLPYVNGNVCVISPSIMKGYYNKDDLTAKKIRNGWLLTGDIGYKDKNGYLYILSRADDMIIKAGMNIYPKEIENALIRFPEIKEIVAYGIREKNGQEIAVDVVLNGQYKYLSRKELLALFSDCLEPYLLPSYINIVESLNRNASGKIIRPKNL